MEQRLPQKPQLLLLFCGLIQVPPQLIWPVGQHLLLEQVSLPLQQSEPQGLVQQVLVVLPWHWPPEVPQQALPAALQQSQQTVPHLTCGDEQMVLQEPLEQTLFWLRQLVPVLEALQPQLVSLLWGNAQVLPPQQVWPGRQQMFPQPTWVPGQSRTQLPLEHFSPCLQALLHCPQCWSLFCVLTQTPLHKVGVWLPQVAVQLPLEQSWPLGQALPH